MPTTDPSTRPRRLPWTGAATRLLAAVLALVVSTVVLSGCDLRRETPDVVEPTPDAVESARQQAVDDALALDAAAQAASPAAGADVAGLLGQVSAASVQHVEQLGGEYDSGLDEATPSAAASPVTPVASAADVLTELGEAAAAARDEAVSVPDGPLARLLTAVSTSRALLATSLAGALGAAVPPGAEAAALPGTTDAADVTGATGTTDTASAPAAPSDPEPTATALPNAALTALALAEDQAGYGLEVAAARLSGGQRDTAKAAAARHRAQAQTWAEAAQVAGTAQDPRRVAYTLPAGSADAATAAALARQIETTLTATYTDAVAAAGTEQRPTLIALARGAALASLAWGATPNAFPGMTEQAAAA